MRDLLGAEWLKLRTTRVLLVVIPAAVVLSAAAVAGVVLSADDLEGVHGVRLAFSVTGAGAIIVLVMGIIMAAGEHQHGTAVDTFLTSPRRHRVVTARLILGAAVGLGTGVLTSAASVGVVGILYRIEGARLPLGAGEVALSVLGTMAYSTLFAVIGVAFGSLLRNQVIAVAAALVWFAIVEHTVVNLLPAIGRWLPAGAGQALLRTPLDGLLSPWAGAGVLLGYAAVLAAIGVRVTVERDV